MGKTVFECKPCSRCGGSGHYSFNLKDGSICYGCGGRGYQYTKRGEAASKFYNDLLTIRLGDVQPGQYLWDTWPSGHWRKVESTDPAHFQIRYADGTQFDYSQAPDSTIRRRAQDEAERLEFLGRALAYQDTLTKAGKPRKR